MFCVWLLSNYVYYISIKVFINDVHLDFFNLFMSVYADKSDICGGILTASSGNIVSPGYPLVSYTNVHCLWIVRVPSAQSIRLDISYFNIYKTENCLDDYILLYKRGYYSPEYGTDRFCGTERNISPSITYNGNEVWLQFNAGSQSRPRSYRGFDIRYVATVSETTTKPAITGMKNTLSFNGSISFEGFQVYFGSF